MKSQGLDDYICKRFSLNCPEANLSEWEQVIFEEANPVSEVTIGMVGKYIELPDAYKSVIEALKHGGLKNRVSVNIKLIDSQDVETRGVEILKGLDAILVPGGFGYRGVEGMITTARFARENNIPYLGICLGEQLIYTYFALRKMVEEQGYEGDLVKAICDLREQKGADFSVLEKVPDHRYTPGLRGHEDEGKHDVNVVPGTILHRLVGRDTIRAASHHYLDVPPGQDLVTINAWSAKGDHVVEGCEYGDNFLGVQFHPEVDDLLPEIFAFLTEEDSHE